MTLVYADFEPADDAGLNDIIEEGGAAFAQSAAAAFPGRGGFGVTYTSDGSGTNRAFGVKSISMTLGAGESVFLSVDFRVRSWTKVSAYFGTSLINLRDTGGAGQNMQWLLFDANGDCNLMVRTYNDALASFDTPVQPVEAGRWYRATMELHRAATSSSADGYGALWVDGVYVGKTADVDNYDRVDDSMEEIWIGSALGTPGATSEMDVDNVVCALGIWAPPAQINASGVGCIARAANLAGFGNVGVQRRHAAI